jgi:NAD(P)-dependent dehydrogenase (short-subunit alcohol dehydrogenase family)
VSLHEGVHGTRLRNARAVHTSTGRRRIDGAALRRAKQRFVAGSPRRITTGSARALPLLLVSGTVGEAMTERFHDKTILVTGGTTGIGLAAAQRFVAEGARVIATGTTPANVEAARRALGANAEVRQSDAGARADLEALARDLRGRGTRLDAMFLNAGVVRIGTIAELDEAALDECMRINFKGPWLAIKLLAPLVVDGGAIVATTSVNDRIGGAMTSAYAASKAALRSLVRVAATELAPRGIRVNAICPGPIETPLRGKIQLTPDQARARDEGERARIPLHRFGRAEEVAAAVAFLASGDASFATGAELVVDGGMTTT